MKVIKTTERNGEDGYKKFYVLDEVIQVASFADIVKKFEGTENLMIKCSCHSFSDSGSPSYYVLYKSEDIISMNETSNPSIMFSADFGDKNTKDYKFSIGAATNSNILIYEVSKKKLENNQAKGHARS